MQQQKYLIGSSSLSWVICTHGSGVSQWLVQSLYIEHVTSPSLALIFPRLPPPHFLVTIITMNPVSWLFMPVRLQIFHSCFSSLYLAWIGTGFPAKSSDNGNFPTVISFFQMQIPLHCLPAWLLFSASG